MKSIRTAQTLKIDISKGFLEGFVQASYQALAQLILLEVYLKPQNLSGETEQALVFSSSFLGMFFSIFYGPIVQRFNLKKSTLVNIPTFLASICLFLTVLVDNTYYFVAFISLAHFLFPLRIPFMTEIYRDNYPDSKRGTYHSWALIASQVGSVLVIYIGGYILKSNPEYWKSVIVTMGVAGLLTCQLVRRIPTTKVKATESKIRLFKGLSHLKTDRLFSYLLFIWFIFGFANLWIFPIRVTYLSTELSLDPFTVSIYSAVLPEITRLVFLPFWAYLFDRINFFLLRMILNIFLLLGIWFFFNSDSLLGIGLGAFLHGIGFSGGRLAWTLWVTKIAKKELTSDYMAVHVGSTGLRGVVGPFIGFYVLSTLPQNGDQYQYISYISCLMVLVSILMLFPILKHGRQNK